MNDGWSKLEALIKSQFGKMPEEMDELEVLSASSCVLGMMKQDYPCAKEGETISACGKRLDGSFTDYVEVEDKFNGDIDSLSSEERGRLWHRYYPNIVNPTRVERVMISEKEEKIWNLVHDAFQLNIIGHSWESIREQMNEALEEMGYK